MNGPTGKGHTRPTRAARVHGLGKLDVSSARLFRIYCCPTLTLPRLPLTQPPLSISPFLSSNRQDNAPTTSDTLMRGIVPYVNFLAAAVYLGQVLAFLPLGPIVGFASSSSRSDLRPRTLRVCPSKSTSFGIGGSERPPLPRFKNPFRTRTLLVRPSTSTSLEIGSSEVPPNVPSVASKKQGYVYVLELEGDEHHDSYYYVGFAQNVGRRLRAHFQGEGSHWTKMHPPCSVMEVSEGGLLEERHKTIEIMKTYGWVKTRGSNWCSRVMTVPPRELRIAPNEQDLVSVLPTSRGEEEGRTEGRMEEGQDVPLKTAPRRTGRRRAVVRTLRTLAILAAVAALNTALGVAIRAR